MDVGAAGRPGRNVLEPAAPPLPLDPPLLGGDFVPVLISNSFGGELFNAYSLWWQMSLTGLAFSVTGLAFANPVKMLKYALRDGSSKLRSFRFHKVNRQLTRTFFNPITGGLSGGR